MEKGTQLSYDLIDFKKVVTMTSLVRIAVKKLST